MEVFSKLLSRTDVTTRMAVKTKALQHIQFPEGQHWVNLEVKDSAGGMWRIRCNTRRIGRYRKPVFGAGWLHFVRRKGLRAGDKVLFYKEDEQTDRYRVQVKRKILTLMGHDIWVDVEQVHLYVADA